MSTPRRHDGRLPGDLRPVKITPDFVRTASGSCLIEVGGTRVICTASFEPGVPGWRKGMGQGWLTAEYGMLPGSTSPRKSRPLLKRDGRDVEIQRLIGRVLRTAVRFDRLGENTLTVDCDVLEADGGTRTAAITGGYVALARALRRAAAEGRCARDVLGRAAAAVSVGLVAGRAVLDLDYAEDSSAEVDMNVAMNAAGGFIEVQSTAEGRPFAPAELNAMLRLARRGIGKLLRLQKQAIEGTK